MCECQVTFIFNEQVKEDRSVVCTKGPSGLPELRFTFKASGITTVDKDGEGGGGIRSFTLSAEQYMLENGQLGMQELEAASKNVKLFILGI